MTPLQVGALAPEFSLIDTDGRQHTLTDFRGGPVILAFAPHRDSADRLVFQHLTFEGERLPVLTPADETVAQQYGVRDRFAVFMIAGSGEIAWRHAMGDATLEPLTDTPVSGVNRREFLAAMLAASIAASFTSNASASTFTESAASTAAETVEIALIVNDRPARLSLDPRVTLLDALREHLHLTGTKKGCDHGQCGACTVHVDDRRVLSCLTLAAGVRGKRVTTVEGLARGEQLHPMQQAFIEYDAFQCGYCTAGQLMSAVALLGEPCGSNDEDVRECMSGNLCRCGAYPGIVAAVQSVRGNRS